MASYDFPSDYEQKYEQYLGMKYEGQLWPYIENWDELSDEIKDRWKVKLDNWEAALRRGDMDQY